MTKIPLTSATEDTRCVSPSLLMSIYFLVIIITSCITLYDTSGSLSAAESVRIIYCYMYCDAEVKSDTNV